MAIRIVTDSTADLPPKYVREYGIGVVPLNVHFGDEVFKDGVDIWSDEFYHRLKNEPILPSTSQPSPGEFLKVYQKIAAPGDTIISIHLSSEFSGTIGSAKIAADMAEGFAVIPVDSRSATMGLGWMVLQAARLAGTGASVSRIMETLEEIRQKMVVHFTVTSLEYLHRTGRIGKAGVYLGSLLNIKPLLTLNDGMIVPFEKIRGNIQKIADRMIDDLKSRFGDHPLLISIVQGESDEIATVLEKTAKQRLHIKELIPAVAGPIIGAHTGPSVSGIVTIPQ